MPNFFHPAAQGIGMQAQGRARARTFDHPARPLCFSTLSYLITPELSVQKQRCPVVPGVTGSAVRLLSINRQRWTWATRSRSAVPGR
jgi:hypothetical protein